MKLLTTIKPRKDGTVISRFGAEVCVFKPGEDGDMACDVADPAHIAFLLNTGNFYPANPEDYEEAVVVASAEDAEDDDDDAMGDDNAAPVESGTPPSNFKRGGRGKRAAAE